MKNVMEQIRKDACVDEFKKIAEDPKEKNIGYWKGTLGALRAKSHGNKASHIIGNKEWIKEHGGSMVYHGLKGGVIGAGVGTGVGAVAALIAAKKSPKGLSKLIRSTTLKTPGLIGAGAAAGAIGGLATGEVVGDAIGNKEFLAKRGITHKGLFFPRGYRFTGEAKKKYRVED